MNADEARVAKPHNIADLNTLSIAMQPGNQKPVASRVESRVHRRSFAGLYGYDVLPDQGAGAEQTGAIEGGAGEGARRRLQQCPY